MEHAEFGSTLILEAHAKHLLDAPATIPAFDEIISGGLWYWNISEPEQNFLSPAFWKSLGYEGDDLPDLHDDWIKRLFDMAARRLSHGDLEMSGLSSFDQTLAFPGKSGKTVVLRCAGTAELVDGQPIRLAGHHTVMGDPYKVIDHEYDVKPQGAFVTKVSPEMRLRHRIRNVFGIVLSIARLSARGTQDLGDYIDQIDGRFTALSAAHSADVADSAAQTTSFKSVVESVLSAFDGFEMTLSADEHDIGMTDDLLTPFSLMLHELANSARYTGAWTFHEGRVDVSWHIERRPGRLPQIVLNWCQTPPPRNNDRTNQSPADTLRDTLIDTSIQQLRAKRDVHIEGASQHMRITFSPQG